MLAALQPNAEAALGALETISAKAPALLEPREHDFGPATSLHLRRLVVGQPRPSNSIRPSQSAARPAEPSMPISIGRTASALAPFTATALMFTERGRSWVSGSNVFSEFFNALPLSELLEASVVTPIVVATEVRAELPKVPEFKHSLQALLMSSGVSPHEILVGTEEHRVYSRLRANRVTGSDRDAGEHACIAIAKNDPEMVFLTDDENALFTAARQVEALPCCVATWPSWLKHVAARGAKPDPGLCRSAARHFQGRARLSLLVGEWPASLGAQ